MLDDWQELADFKAFVKSLELEHFNYFEILTGVFKKRGSIINEPPPKEIWHNVGPSILVLDELRKHFDVAITINSAYRDPEYNASIPGAKKSQHMGFVAIDINVRGVNPNLVADQLTAWQDQEKWFDSPIELTPVDVTVAAGKIPRVDLETRVKDGKFQFKYVGGIGRYTTFTHMDTRGIPARWDNRNHDSGKRSRSLTAEPVILD